ncbi:hypothetical protein Rhe02_16070 [Rhizocola hellebori]|uniref:Uncharacterized protein n=1 Tax=Rhizocola hellebori TaxID=1392758 RepID=A0A8J3Q488_9ACTN|nr:hypothetical protein [Rhizocola hellebori]GIH03540.1 hypothetical protein Rhe02_16070 [Rhizocola hellebori]
MKRGVYFLANDAILDFAVTFLNSFRANNPDIALCLVPFDDDHAQVARLAGRYGFTRWRDDEELRRCDAISRAFHNGETWGHYRKLALWKGQFDEFLYIDSDTVVLEPVDFVFEHLGKYDFVTSHSNMASIRRWVWKDSIYAASALTSEQIDYAANTGFFASRPGLIDTRLVHDNVTSLAGMAAHMELKCREQPLLNYLVVTSGRPYSSLSRIARETGDPTIPQEQWAGADIGEVESGRLIASQVQRVLLVHWAGEWRRAYWANEQLPYLSLWQHYHTMHEDHIG